MTKAGNPPQKKRDDCEEDSFLLIRLSHKRKEEAKCL